MQKIKPHQKRRRQKSWDSEWDLKRPAALRVTCSR